MTSTKPRLRISSANLRMSWEVSGPLLRPKMKAKMATRMKTSKGTVMGAVTTRRCCPVTSRRSQTTITAPRAKSKKVGVMTILKGRVAKGSRQMTATTPHMPISISRRTMTAANTANNSPAAIIGPPKARISPPTRAVNPMRPPMKRGDWVSW